MRDDRLRLATMRSALAAIERYTSQGKARLQEQELVQLWTLHHLQLLGEAAGAISPEFRDQHPALLLAQVIGLRNTLVQQHFDVDPREVRAILERDLPALIQAPEGIL